MEINYNNYIQLDEEELLQEEEKHRKEIQALLINELDNIEIDEDVDDDVDEAEDNIDKSKDILNQPIEDQDSRYEIESSINDKENNFSRPFNVLNNFVSNWSMAPYRQYYNVALPTNDHNFHYKFMQTNNNYNEGIEDSSINWEISLHDEMGVPTQNKCDQVLSSNAENFIHSNRPHKLIPNEKPRTLNYKNVITRDIGIECIPATQRELDNLELLYAARGKRIEQLQLELDADREKRIKETRILNHKITLLESELRNESNLLKSVREELECERQAVAEHQSMINSQNSQITKLESNIDVLKENIESCNIIIGGLNEQLSDLTSKSSLSRNNQKHADLLDCLNRQFDTDSYRLKAEIQRISERVEEKMKEIAKLEALLDEQAENHRIQKQDWKCEKDGLLEELEKEKALCKELVNSTGQEKLEQLNNNIRDVQLEKSLAEDMNEYLQELLMELSQQVATYEESFQSLNRNDMICTNMDQEDIDNEYQFDIRASCPELSALKNVLPGKQNQFDFSKRNIDLQKQIFVLMSRSKSLTDRLLEVRKTNLDSKGSVKKLQKTIDEKINCNEILQKKFVELEQRLNAIQNGEETVLEKQLKMSLESLEIVKNSLEQQCKGLQNQLKQATDSMKESEKSYVQLEEEFILYKELAEKDKIKCMEDVKMVCDNHYDNLRKQLEQSWKVEKELLLDKEKDHRDQLMQDLSDSVKEVDRVKNLYIQLSQQKSNEEMDKSNWQEWMEKKLEEQKRSLNQQFKKDQESIISELKINHQSELDHLKSELRAKLWIKMKDECEGTVAPIMVNMMCSYDQLETVDRQIQVGNAEDDQKIIVELTLANDKLMSSLNSYQKECSRLKKEYDSVYNLKMSLEKENQLLCSKTSVVKHPSSVSSNSNLWPQLTTIECQENVETTLPSIIRSTTPQLILTSKRKQGPPSMQSPLSEIHSQFKILKEDLINQLSEVSKSMPLGVKNRLHCPDETMSLDALYNGITVDNFKERLYDFIFDIQVRAAKTLQEELLKSQNFIKQSLVEQLKPVISVMLSVDGQVLGIPPEKIKILVDKVILTINHLKSNQSLNVPSVDDEFINSRISSNFKITSTPRKNRFPSNIYSDSTKTVPISMNTSFDSWTSSIKSHISQEIDFEKRQTIENECKHLKDEIAQLSKVLSQSKSSSSNCEFPFDNVDCKPSRYLSSDYVI